jgi:4-amino-4-deoxy-L-arabinose transferase-like glycosyltransferase
MLNKNRQSTGATRPLSGLIWLGMLVLLLGAGLRFFQLSQYPPGFHYDEAVNFIVAREIAFYDARPFPVFAAFNGREVFYFYVNALAMVAIGEHIFTMHFVSAMMSLVTVAATIGLGRTLFGGRKGLLVGLLAGAFLAVSFPQILLARQAFRAISQPMLQALSLWALFAALRTGLRKPSLPNWLPWLAMGAVLGAAVLYTYMASRLFPLWVGLALIFLWMTDGQQRGLRFRQGAFFGLILLLAAMPIIEYYAENPDVFEDRLSQLSASEDNPTYAESIGLHAEMFFIEGDPYIRYNEPLTPYFDPVTGFFLLLGLGVSLWRAFAADEAVARSAYFLVALSPLMVIPSVLAVGGLPPSHMRSIGMVPTVFFLPAIGLLFSWEQLRRLSAGAVPYLTRRPVPNFLAIGGILVLGLWTWNRYTDWAAGAELYYQTDSDMVEAGQWLEDNISDDTLMYVTSLHYDHPSLLIHDLPGDNVTFLLGERLFLPPPERDAYLVTVHNAPLATGIEAWVSEFEAVDHGKGPNGQTSFAVYHPLPWPVSDNTGDGETVGNWLRLVEANLPSAQAGSRATITTAWQILASPAFNDLTPIFVLETPTGDVLARDEPYVQHSQRWRPSEILIQQVTFDIPPGTPPGDYPVRVTWVGRAADEYVGRIDRNNSFAGLWTSLGMLSLERPAEFTDPAALAIEQRQQEQVTLAIRLLGWNPPPEAVRQGERLSFDLFWQATAQPSDEIDDIEIVAINEDDERRLLWQGSPVMDSYPFSEWIAGEVVADWHRWRLAGDVPAGTYELLLNVGEREIKLGQFTVIAVDRQYNPPAVQYSLALNLGDIVGLSGYDLSSETLSPGDSLDLTLVWQSLARTELPLKVFVHLVGPDNVNWDQRDAQPRNYTYPVALWEPGEYVDDTYTLELPPNAPPGNYTLRVGMYLDENNQRLQIVDAHGNPQGDYWDLATITVEEN